jgi:HNH endonuclease
MDQIGTVSIDLHLWTYGHHVVPWGHGRATNLENLVSLCRPHHRAVHEQRWRIHITDGIALVDPPP